ncbi:bifunctional DNA primase/polymerase [Streptomyces sp. NPDC050428]|uniref:bifunctional DNA primase/polymerase n=1 Tax=unclassified Streptomyces TaxID=2593676 RepID=UPI003440F9B4|nr:bifunctional DNA primase/polymerase [Streptomyces sp. NBC_00838]
MPLVRRRHRQAGARRAADKPHKIQWPEWATSDMDRVIAAGTPSPATNSAIACAPSGLLAVDCDIARGEFALKGTP